tara:strand:+ start:342 stop:1460 length:1119 start_codon:yes stop_codon:yes gene_type:complete
MVSKLHIDFHKPLKEKDRFFSFFRSRKTIAGLIIVLIIIWMAPGFWGSIEEEKATDKKDSTEKVFIVSAQRVQNRDTFKVVRASGVLKPVYEIDVLSKKDGEVKDIVRQRGQFLNKDDIILEIDKGTILQQLEAGEAALRLEEKNYSIAESLLKKNMASELNLVRAEAALTKAKADVATLQNNLDNSTVLAGIEGILESLSVEAGQFVKKNQKIGKIIDLSKMLLFAPVAQTDVAKISLKDEVVINVTGVGNRRGEVKRIASSASEATRTFVVEIEIDNKDEALKAGMSAEIGILVEKVQAFSISPAHLVIGEDGSLKVKTVKENKVYERDVFLVRTSGDFALVSGLQNDEIVLTTGQAFVSPGDEIEYKIN